MRPKERHIVSTPAKREYLQAVYPRYRQARRREKQRILDEFCRIAGYHRKYAIRLLNGPPPGRPRAARRRAATYGPAVITALHAIWQAAGYPWSVRLKALLPLWLPWARHRLRLARSVERQLLAISPRQIDRRLAPHKRHLKKRLYGRTKPGTLLKHHIPIKTDAWVETGAVLGKGAAGIARMVDELRAALPFALRGLDSDNGTEFINGTLYDYCQAHEIQFTRGRPYKKDDNAHVEQKNWTHVRKLLGYVRYDSPAALAAINDLYRHELRLFQNLFLPSVKLVGKLRVGSRLRRRYDAPRTPLERVQAAPQQDRAKVAALLALRQRLDPFVLAQTIDAKIERLYALANHRQSPGPVPGPIAGLPPLAAGRRSRRRGGFPSITFGKNASPQRRRLVTS